MSEFFFVIYTILHELVPVDFFSIIFFATFHPCNFAYLISRLSYVLFLLHGLFSLPVFLVESNYLLDFNVSNTFCTLSPSTQVWFISFLMCFCSTRHTVFNFIFTFLSPSLSMLHEGKGHIFQLIPGLLALMFCRYSMHSWASYLISQVSLSFLISKMRIISLGSSENCMTTTV